MITVANESFKTKTALEEKIRAILWSYKVGDKLNNYDFVFIRGLLDRHPRAAEKIGPGVVGMVIHDNGMGTQGFSSVWVDGTIQSFSYKACTSPSTKWTKFSNAARNEIHDQTHAFKVETFRVTSQIVCPVHGISVTWDLCEIDHQPPDTFDTIIKVFLAHRNLQHTDVVLVKISMGACNFGDRVLATEWHSFHRAKAKLRAVSKKANQGEIRKQHNLSKK